MLTRHPSRWQARAATALVCAAQLAPAAAQTASSCTARSAATVTPVVELYTSEGCNSCPPADKWLSRLKVDPAIVALAFHVEPIGCPVERGVEPPSSSSAVSIGCRRRLRRNFDPRLKTSPRSTSVQ